MVRRSARIQYSGVLKKASSGQVTTNVTIAKQVDEIKKLKAELKKQLKESRDTIFRQNNLEFENRLLVHKCEVLKKSQESPFRIFPTEKVTSDEARVVFPSYFIKEELEKEKKEVEELKKMCLDMLKKQSKEAIDRNGEPFGWQICSICLEQFTEEDLHTPRVLKCGHTFCLGCITKLWKSGAIKCPTCREQMWYMNPSAVTKNFMLADVFK